MEIEKTNKMLKKLKDHGFQVLSFGDSFKNPFEEISPEYFNEKVNDALED